MPQYQLKSHVPFLIARVAALAREAVAPVMREYALTLPMWRVLASLYDDGEHTMGQLLVATSLEQSTLSRTVAALQRRGYVTRRTFRDKTRPVTFALLARGRAVNERLLPHLADAHTSIVAGVDDADLEIFKRVLDQLYRNVARADNTPTARMRQRVHAAGRLIAVAVACWALALPAPARAATPLDPYEINAVIPLTGGGAFLGKAYVDTFRAIELAVNASGGIHGHPVKFVTADTQTNGQVDLQLVNGLIAKHVPVFIDGAPSTVCLPSIPLVVTAGPVDYCLSPAIHPPAGSYVFSTNASTLDLATVAVRYARQRAWKRIGLIASTDATGQDYDRQVAAVLALPENRDLQLVAHEHFNPTDISATAQISALKNAAPNVIFAYTTGTPLATVLRGINDAGIALPVVTLNSNMSYAQMSAYASFMPKELYFTTLRSLTPEGTLRGPLRDAQTTFVNAYRAVNVRPDIGSVLAYDPAMIVIDALRHIGTQATAQQIRDYILHLHGWIGANGVYDFSSGDQRGLSQNSIVVARWSPQKNAWVQVSRPGGTLK